MIKPRIFLAAPISGFTNKNEYEIYRIKVLSLISFLRKAGYDVCSELESITDDTGYDSPSKSATEDFQRISQSDIFLMLHPQKMQTSTLIELGYACALKKRIVIVGNRSNILYLALGLQELSNPTIIIEANDLSEKVFTEIVHCLKA